MSRGIDVSHWNTCTNYAAAKGAIDWVYIKITEGSSITDPAWLTHYNGFAGKPRGAYHFMRGSSTAEVAQFVRVLKSRTWELPPMLDAEYPGVTGQAIKAFLVEFQRQTGQELTIVYAGKSHLETSCNPALFITPRTIIWAARYFKNSADFGTLGWDHPQLGVYQYWNAGSVPGFTGGIDLDIARVDLNGENVALTNDDLNAIATKLYWGTVFDTNGNANYAGYLKNTLNNLNAQLVAANTAIAGLSQAVARISTDPDLTVAQMTEIVNNAIAENIHITGTVEITSDPHPAV